MIYYICCWSYFFFLPSISSTISFYSYVVILCKQTITLIYRSWASTTWSTQLSSILSSQELLRQRSLIQCSLKWLIFLPLSELVSELRWLRWLNSFLSLNWDSFDRASLCSSSSFFYYTTWGNLKDSTLLHRGAACLYLRYDFIRLLESTN